MSSSNGVYYQILPVPQYPGHLISNDPARPYMCQLCLNTQATIEHLKLHWELNHNVPCGWCGARFDFKSSRDSHETVCASGQQGAHT
ncbi:hypothetical protein M422DRAFT_251757 [Sphaerobolus stellatus SS14]|uniref:Unplaced genomic scaffold SPHSTscaffold_40, whole genome shotgun sequence n=1 Tax=Sphaerobolus stellatus (strain SS14) TaxID=990650 RepID=A0A0C9UP98_SPHS4|nr:hypothetical protein M422DRAFT_251757 [Sphaerobolus stellatus SS14]